MNRAVISLGSNISPEQNISKATESLKGAFTVLALSAIVRTEPLGVKDQPDFLNGVALLETDLDMSALQVQLKQLEADLGRIPRVDRWGPREIDLDVLIWNGQVVNKDYYERNFLKTAVAEILPNLKLRCC